MKKLKPLANAAAAAAVCLLAGCASYQARKQLENVAKGWCQTIRASQVIPVYPLTEDLVVGDVFLVRTPISRQAAEYTRNGFLPLDDHVMRLKYTNFSSFYFDGYWGNTFGATPHPQPEFTNAAAITNGQPVALTAAPIPRAAFPSYSFKAQSGFGVNLALPIQGIPVALSYLNSQQVDGSVTISDARTYGGDTSELYQQLRRSAGGGMMKKFLASVALNGGDPKPVFLRVVSRIYYARAIDVALHRSGSQGGGAKAGVINDVQLMSTNASADASASASYTNLLGLLTATANSTASAAQAGGALKFVSAGTSTVGLSQSFDRLLAIGYLGFDVPISTNGDIGWPVPTFQHLTGKIPAEVPMDFARVTIVPLSPELFARQTNLFAAWQKLDANQASKVLDGLGLPSGSKEILQNRIGDAQTAADLDALEKAFKAVQPPRAVKPPSN